MKCLDDFSQMGGFAGSWAHVFCPLSLCKFTSFSHCISLSVMFYSLWPPWTVTYQALLFMGFSRQGYWSGLPFPSPGDLPNLGIKPGSPAWQVDSLPSEPPRKLIQVQWEINELLNISSFSTAASAFCFLTHKNPLVK